MKANLDTDLMTCVWDNSELQSRIRAIINRIAPEATEILESQRDEIVLNPAISDWPVKTGKSKAGLKPYLSVNNQEIRVGIYDSVDYTYMIKVNKKSVWQALVVKPMKALGAKLPTDVRDRLTEVMRKELGNE